MLKGYIVASIRAHDTDGMAAFASASGSVIAEFESRVLSRDPSPELREGEVAGLCVNVAFDDVETARRFRVSQGGTDAKAIWQVAADTGLRMGAGL